MEQMHANTLFQLFDFSNSVNLLEIKQSLKFEEAILADHYAQQKVKSLCSTC